MTIQALPQEPYGGPFVIPEVDERPDGTFTTAEIAALVTSPGRDLARTAQMVRHYQRSGFIHPAALESRGRRAWFYRPATVLVVEALVRMGMAGIADKDASHAISFALLHWKGGVDFEGDEPPARSPAAHILEQYAQGARDWYVELHLFHHPQYGARFEANIRAVERGEGTALLAGRGDGYEIIWSSGVSLTTFLDRNYHCIVGLRTN